MDPKLRLRYFLFFLLPTFVASFLLYVVYSMQVDEHVAINLPAIAALTLIFSALLTWSSGRKHKKE